MRRAQQVLEAGEVLILFPEGERRSGPVVEDLHEGVAFLAARTGATVVPVGIGGSASVMPKGTKIPRPRHIHLEVGTPLPPPERTGSRPGAPQPDPPAHRGAHRRPPGPLRPLGRGHRPLLIGPAADRRAGRPRVGPVPSGDAGHALALGPPRRRLHLAPGDVLVLEGNPSGPLWVLVSGELAVVKGGTEVNTISRPGAVIGEISLLLGHHHGATVQATTPGDPAGGR